jgi:hypothetical protein
LEALRQASPIQASKIFAHFDALEPNVLHYILADAISNGHSVITTNWDTLIEKAAKRLDLYIPTKIWNPQTDRWDSQTVQVNKNEPATSSSGTLFKIHGSIDSDILSYIHQFTLDAPDEVRNVLAPILSNTSVFFLGYSFSDYFDCQGIINDFSEKNVSVFVLKHDNNRIYSDLWRPLNSFHPHLENIVSKSGYAAHTSSYMKNLFPCFDKYIVEKKDILNGITKEIEKWDQKHKCRAIFWLMVNMGKPNKLCEDPITELRSESDWHFVINQVQAQYLAGRLNEAISIIERVRNNQTIEFCGENALIFMAELLERGIEISLSNALWRYTGKYRREIERIYASAKAKSKESTIVEIKKRIKQAANNLKAMKRMVVFLNVFTRDVMKSIREEIGGRDFFALNIRIYDKRSKAVKGGDTKDISRCFKYYLEMCNIDGALGTITDLGLHYCTKDLNSAISLLQLGKEVFGTKTGSVFARVKLYALLSSLLMVERTFCQESYRRRSSNCRDEVCNYIKSICTFDSKKAVFAWFLRSFIFFFMKGMVRGAMSQIKNVFKIKSQ